MKKTILIFLLVTFLTNSYAQEVSPNINPKTTTYSGYGGPLLSGTLINNEPGIVLGGKGGAIINNTLEFGGIGFGTINTSEFTGNNLSGDLNSPLNMSYGAGGIYFGYVFNTKNPIHFSIPVNLMAGGIHVYENESDAEIESSAFFIIEPGIEMNINLSKNYTQSIFVSYRQAIGSSLINFNNQDISGLNVGFVFKFGYHSTYSK